MKEYKDLYIVRHGKSEANYSSISDIDRSLEERGVLDSYVMAERFLKNKKIPERIISSSAARALHTAAIFARVFNLPFNKLTISGDMYLAEIGTVLNSIKNVDETIKSIMIFGHNPTFTDLANYYLIDKIDNIPTNGIVGLKFESLSWDNITKLKSVESFFDFPKNIQ